MTDTPANHSVVKCLREVAARLWRGQAGDSIACERAADRIEALEDALHRIVSWADSYPLQAFPEPDMGRVAKVLRDHDMTLDAVSASCMRHCIKGAGDIARAALGDRATERQVRAAAGGRE